MAQSRKYLKGVTLIEVLVAFIIATLVFSGAFEVVRIQFVNKTVSVLNGQVQQVAQNIGMFLASMRPPSGRSGQDLHVIISGDVTNALGAGGLDLADARWFTNVDFSNVPTNIENVTLDNLVNVVNQGDEANPMWTVTRSGTTVALISIGGKSLKFANVQVDNAGSWTTPSTSTLNDLLARPALAVWEAMSSTEQSKFIQEQQNAWCDSVGGTNYFILGGVGKQILVPVMGSNAIAGDNDLIYRVRIFQEINSSVTPSLVNIRVRVDIPKMGNDQNSLLNTLPATRELASEIVFRKFVP